MLAFLDYLVEKLNETGAVVPVTHYFNHGPDVHFQGDIPTILKKLKHGKLHPIQKTLRLDQLIPTQYVVSLPKVLKKHGSGDDPSHPIVVLHDRTLGLNFLIDGHHRAAALLLNNRNVAVPCTVLDSEDCARVLKF
jgi:hypothetical protein